MNAYIHTYSGRIIDLFDIKDEDIILDDIAHGLACANRFAGQAAFPISVAQHSIFVAKLCSAQHQLQALLHDASEAYLGDVTKWLKATKAMAAYREFEEALQRRIFTVFGCPDELAYEVELADRVMARFEGVKSFKNFVLDHPDYPPLTKQQLEVIGYWSSWPWHTAESIYRSWARELMAHRHFCAKT